MCQFTYCMFFFGFSSGLDRPALYACENDHNAVDVIRNTLDAPLYVKECMVDRICSDRQVTSNAVRIIKKSKPLKSKL